MKKKIIDITIYIIIALALVWVCIQYFDISDSRFTNNAQVRQDMVSVSCKVQGYIRKINFDEYSYVEKGDTLVVIEDSEYRLALAQAEAAYRNAVISRSAADRGLKTAGSNVAVSEATIEEVRTNLENARTNYERYSKLLEKGAVTRQEYENVQTQYLAMKARYETTTRQKESSTLAKAEMQERLEQNEAGIEIAAAALELARLNLSYTVITAPCSGYTSARHIQEGELMQPGMMLLSIVDDSESYVIANCRERQLQNFTLGSEVEITVDAIPGVTFLGKVQTISGATGAQYSAMPQDNAVGNFVKTEQRVPVRICFEPNNAPEKMSLLRNGLNAEVKVK